MSPVLRTRFADYAAFHASSGNQLCHYLGIPLIVLTLLSFLSAVPLLELGGLPLTLAEPVLAGVVIYYFRLDAPLAGLMLAAFVVLDLAARRLPLSLAVALFLLGWALQFAGHYVWEKKSPAFFSNLTHLLVGPLWIAAKAVGRA